jgi:hypothetical protein
LWIYVMARRLKIDCLCSGEERAYLAQQIGLGTLAEELLAWLRDRGYQSRDLKRQQVFKWVDRCASGDLTAPQPTRQPSRKERQREDYSDLLLRFREFASERGLSFTLAMRMAIERFMEIESLKGAAAVTIRTMEFCGGQDRKDSIRCASDSAPTRTDRAEVDGSTFQGARDCAGPRRTTR